MVDPQLGGSWVTQHPGEYSIRHLILKKASTGHEYKLRLRLDYNRVASLTEFEGQIMFARHLFRSCEEVCNEQSSAKSCILRQPQYSY